MRKLTIENVPPGLYERLKAAAERAGRSLDSEVIHRLEQSVDSTRIDAEALLAQVDALRARNRVPYLTDEALRAARDEGRE